MLSTYHFILSMIYIEIKAYFRKGEKKKIFFFCYKYSRERGRGNKYMTRRCGYCFEEEEEKKKWILLYKKEMNDETIDRKNEDIETYVCT